MKGKIVESDFLARVTAYFVEKRGRGAFVSPADIALLLEWERAGAPASAVARGIDRAVEALGEVRSVRGCRRFVADEVKGAGSLVTRRPSTSTDGLRPAVEAAVFSLDDLRLKYPAAGDAFLRALKRLNGVLETIDNGGVGSPAAVVEELTIIEDGLADDLAEGLPTNELADKKKRVEDELFPYRTAMGPAEFEATVEATLRAAVLRRFGARGVLEI